VIADVCDLSFWREITVAEITVVVQPTPTRVVTVGVPGPSGPPGPSGAAQTYVAGALLGGGRVVAITAAGAVIADPGTPLHLGAVVGLTLGAVTAGATFAPAGPGAIVIDPAWSWTVGAHLFVAASGLLSPIPPVVGWVQRFARALSPTSILILPFDPIQL
jgi:hypothetical protein